MISILVIFTITLKLLSILTSTVDAMEKCGPFENSFKTGPNEEDFDCSCNPLTVYHESSDACYPVYKQGPCNNGELFVPISRYKGICQPQKCADEEKIWIENECVSIGSACNGGMGILAVEAYTMQFRCFNSTEDKITSRIRVPEGHCKPGCQINKRGHCRGVKQCED